MVFNEGINGPEQKISNGTTKAFLSGFTHPKDFWLDKIFKDIYEINIRNFVRQLNITKLAWLFFGHRHSDNSHLYT